MSDLRSQALTMRGAGMTQVAIARALGVGRTTIYRWTREQFPTPTMEQRFWAKVDRRGVDECWPWTGAKIAPWGYGSFAVLRRTTTAHRVAYELTVGPIPAGLFVLHRCDNPPCCNPAHLFLGTAADNSADMVAKGRGRGKILTGEDWRQAHLAGLPRGEAHHAMKVTDAQVAEIRERWARGDITQEALGRLFGLSQVHIGKIVSGRARVHG